MPKMRLTDSEVRKLSHCPTTWYSELRPNMHAGLRLCVGRSMKTFYASKRNPHTGKVMSVMVGDKANGLTALRTTALDRAADESEHDGDTLIPTGTLAVRRREGNSGALVR